MITEPLVDYMRQVTGDVVHPNASTSRALHRQLLDFQLSSDDVLQLHSGAMLLLRGQHAVRGTERFEVAFVFIGERTRGRAGTIYRNFPVSKIEAKFGCYRCTCVSQRTYRCQLPKVQTHQFPRCQNRPILCPLVPSAGVTDEVRAHC